MTQNIYYQNIYNHLALNATLLILMTTIFKIRLHGSFMYDIWLHGSFMYDIFILYTTYACNTNDPLRQATVSGPLLFLAFSLPFRPQYPHFFSSFLPQTSPFHHRQSELLSSMAALCPMVLVGI